MSGLRLKFVLACGVAFGAILASGAIAAPTQILRPNTITTAGPVSTTLNGQTFTNQGLQGVNRLSALTTKDFAGDTFGAYSGLDVLPGTWRKTATGYTGVLYSLPDRGPNGVGAVTFSDYAARVNSFDMSFTPYTGSAALSASANVLQLTQKGGFFFKDFNGNLTTGLDPQLPSANSFITQGGYTLPGSKIGAAAGKISLDAEALRFLNDGSFYVGDEYGANVYYFDASGNLKGVVAPPPALIPRTADGTTLSYTSLADAATGRRLNQGIEGMAVTPDNKKLVTLLQSATYQDTGSGQQTRTNTRLMIYDISTTKSPTAPVGDYVLQLPIYNLAGTGGAADRTAAQSELLALNDSQFLVLSRDGSGLGQANTPPVFKSVLLVDITGATNIAGTAYENSYTPLAPGGSLLAAINPVQQVELVNMLNTTELSRFGINLRNGAPGSGANAVNATTITEKWEGMALVPVLEESAPQDYFLLVGNDNDFLSSTCNTGGVVCAQAVNSDAMVMVYRLTLPTYVEPQFLKSMMDTAPTVTTMTALTSRDLAVASDIGQHLKVRRHDDAIRPAQSAIDLTLWGAGGWSTRDETAKTTKAKTSSATLGVDAQITSNLTLGLAAGLSWSDASGAGASQYAWAAQFSGYGAFEMDGFFANVTGTYSDQTFSDIRRPGAYGLTGVGSTQGDAFAVSGEAGYLMDMGGFRLGPVAGFQSISSKVEGYTETGASGGNIRYPTMTRDSFNGFFGGEASTWLGSAGWLGDMKAILRLTYNTDDSYDAQNATFSLVNAANAMGTQTILVPGLGQAHIAPSATLTSTGPVAWFVNYGANIGVDAGTEHHITGGVKIRL